MKNDGFDKCRAWRVVLVDDHPLLREAYSALIEQENDMTVLHSLDGSEALTTILRSVCVDIVLLDYRLDNGDIDGIALIQRLRSRFPATRLLVCSASDDPVTIAAVMLAGAHGFLSKKAPLEVCACAVRSVASGLRYIYGDASSCRESGSASMSVDAMPSLTLPMDLTIKEFDVLRCSKQGMTPTMIAKKLRRSVKTISGHKASALRKQGITHEAHVFVRHPLSRDR